MFRALNLVASVVLLGVACNASAASLSLVPTTSVTDVQPGDIVAFDIRIDFTADATPVSGGFDIFFDPGALQFVGFSSSGIGDPNFHKDPDILAGHLSTWCDGDFDGLPSIATLGDVTFEVLPAMGADTNIDAAQGSGSCGPWFSLVDGSEIFVTYDGFSVEALDSDGDGDPDHNDPDDDDDRIGDAYDTKPLIANNECTSIFDDNATLVSAQVMDDQTCASQESVDVNGDNGTLNTVVFGPSGDLRVISEKVIFSDTNVEVDGRLEVINADPCPGCDPLPGPGYSDVQPFLEAKCDPCHTGIGFGGHNIGIDYSDALLPADNIDCDGLNVGQCTIVRIQSGDMPFEAGCTGVPAQDAGNAACLTQAEQDLLQAWIDGGLPE